MGLKEFDVGPGYFYHLLEFQLGQLHPEILNKLRDPKTSSNLIKQAGFSLHQGCYLSFTQTLKVMISLAHQRERSSRVAPRPKSKV